jgi:DNA-binding SARP family transcriptional activator
MQIFSQMGNKAAISRQYQLCQANLHDEVGADPSPQTVSLFEKLMR